MDEIKNKMIQKVPKEQRDSIEWNETETDIYLEFLNKKGTDINVVNYDKRENKIYVFNLGGVWF